MDVLPGTSGFSYREWKGIFYPQDVPARAMLEYYATRLPAVEINNTFYRQPAESMLRGWLAQVPPSFRFAIKAPRRITHVKRLRDCEEETALLLQRTAVLSQALGAVLFQLPPHLGRDDGLLGAFIDLMPAGTPVAFEFRHESWFDDATFRRLADANMALAIADTEERPASGLPLTADWAYLRLRKADYADGDLESWLRLLSDARVRQAQIFFKHEDEAAGPKMALRVLELVKGCD
jgi:uncharacterized protein YecE (DUF72 family)